MCGIVCFSGKSNFNQDKINLLLYWNYKERGSDATGFYTPKTGLLKNCDKAEDFLVSQKDKLVPDTMLIGHVRQGTVGKQNPSNAHPFEYKMEGKTGTIIGLQNGTLTNHHKLANEYSLAHKDWDTDTQVLYQCMAKDCNPKVITKLEGSAALVWTDTSIKNNTTLYVYRNSERPLYYGYLPEGMYISSIEKSLKVIGCTDIKQFDTDTLFIIKDGVITKENKVVVKKKPEANNNTYGYSSYSSTPSARKASNLKDQWLKADNNYDRAYGKDVCLKKGKFYLCLGEDESIGGRGDYYAKVIDENGNTVVVSTYYFYETSYAPSVTTKCVIMESVYDAADLTKLVFPAGEVITPTSYYTTNKGTFICAVSKINKVRYEIPVKMLRRVEHDGSENNLDTIIIPDANVKTVDEDTKAGSLDTINVDPPVSNLPKKSTKDLIDSNPVLKAMFKSTTTLEQIEEIEDLVDDLSDLDGGAYCELTDLFEVCNNLIEKIEDMRDDIVNSKQIGDISTYADYYLTEGLDEMETMVKNFFENAVYNTYTNDDLEVIGRSKKND